MASPNIFLGFQKIGIGKTWTIKSIKSQDHAGSKNQQIESSHSQQKHSGQGHLMIGKAFFPKWSQTFVPKSWMTNKPLKEKVIEHAKTPQV